MKIISDLKEGEAVDFNGSFLINLSSGTYEIDGSELSVHYGGRQIMVSSMNDVYRITKSNPVHIGFTKNGEPFGDFDEWQKLYNLNRKYLEDGYPSLDEEFKIRSELKKYEGCQRVMSVPEIVKTKVDIPIVGSYVDTGSPYIDTALHVGKTSYYGRGVFKVNASAIAKSEAVKLQATYPALVLDANHSNVRYLKYNGSYIFNNTEEKLYSFIGKDDDSYIINNLDDAKKKEAEIRAIVRKHVLLKVEPKELGDLSPSTLSDIYNLVNTALNSAYVTQPMKNSRSDLQNVTKTLSKARDVILAAQNSNESTPTV